MKNRSDSLMMIGMVVAVAAIVVAVLIGYYFGVSSTGRADQQQREARMTGEQQESGAAGAPVALGEGAGRATFSGVSELALKIRNGTVSCAEDVTLAEGVVDLSWEYRRSDEPYTAGDVELRSSQKGKLLSVDDWTSRRSWHDSSPNLLLTVRCGPGICCLDASHGNGTFEYDGSAGGEISLGNGTMSLGGAPADDLEASVGNGKLNASLLASLSNVELSVGNGQIGLELREGSGCQLEASVGIGGINAPDGIGVTRSHLLGASAGGTLGSGESTIELSVGNGAIRVSEV